MIHNLTKAEWEALTDAVALQDTCWEQDGDETGEGRSVTAKRRALDRAYTKVRQLAPED